MIRASTERALLRSSNRRSDHVELDRIAMLARAPGLKLPLALCAILLASTTTGVGDTLPDRPLNHQPALSRHALPDFGDLVEQVKPAVVSITSRLQTGATGAAQDTERNQVLPFPFNLIVPQSRIVEARASGFIVKADGTIVTNNHVVAGAVNVLVTLDDGSQSSARIVGRDASTDIAVLKISTSRPLPYLELGDSSTVRSGEWVVAMGNPFGLGGTATVGIVSAQARDVGAGPYEQFIQVDAPINEGNSGGPVFTQDGKVIAMATAMLTPSGGSVGIGFAIPSNVIKAIVPQLEAAGHIVRGFIGVQSQAISQALANVFNLPDKAGALVARVEPDSPAAHAGVAAGDVIRAVNGRQVTSPRDLAGAIANIQPDHQARLDIIRNGRTQNITVTVTAMPEEGAERGGTQEQPHEAGLGLSLGALSPALRRQLAVPEGSTGAVVMRVEPGSPADLAGIAAGDVITSVNNAPVDGVAGATQMIRQAQKIGRAILLRVVRDGRAAFVAIDVTPPTKG